MEKVVMHFKESENILTTFTEYIEGLSILEMTLTQLCHHLQKLIQMFLMQ